MKKGWLQRKIVKMTLKLFKLRSFLPTLLELEIRGSQAQEAAATIATSTPKTPATSGKMSGEVPENVEDDAIDASETKIENIEPSLEIRKVESEKILTTP